MEVFADDILLASPTQNATVASLNATAISTGPLTLQGLLHGLLSLLWSTFLRFLTFGVPFIAYTGYNLYNSQEKMLYQPKLPGLPGVRTPFSLWPAYLFFCTANPCEALFSYFPYSTHTPNLLLFYLFPPTPLAILPLLCSGAWRTTPPP